VTRDLFLFASVFVACLVEGVEALTIVLAAGTTRGWRSALTGTGAALLLLAVIVAVLGPALTVLPIETLRLVVGGLLLIFGLQWLRKAILRASGFKALHDQEAIFAEVAFIVVTFGSNQDNIPLAAAAGVAAVLVVVAAGLVAHAPLTRVPENTLKFAVGVMLTSFGMFWGAEGAGADWPGGDVAILALVGYTLATSLLLVGLMRRRHSELTTPVAA
jgi:uncharacterized membrane protein